MNPIEKDPLQKKIEITNWIVMGLLLALSLFFMSLRFTLGILLGGFISIINFHWLERDLRHVFRRLSEGSKSSLFLKYFVRLALTTIVLYFIISTDIVDVIGLLIGLSAVIITIVFTVVMTYKMKNNVEKVG